MTSRGPALREKGASLCMLLVHVAVYLSQFAFCCLLCSACLSISRACETLAFEGSVPSHSTSEFRDCDFPERLHKSKIFERHASLKEALMSACCAAS